MKIKTEFWNKKGTEIAEKILTITWFTIIINTLASLYYKEIFITIINTIIITLLIIIEISKTKYNKEKQNETGL